MSEDAHQVILNKTRRRTSHKNNLKKTILTRDESSYSSIPKDHIQHNR